VDQTILDAGGEIVAYRARKHRLCTFKYINNTSVRLDAHLAHSLPEGF